MLLLLFFVVLLASAGSIGSGAVLGEYCFSRSSVLGLTLLSSSFSFSSSSSWWPLSLLLLAQAMIPIEGLGNLIG